MSNQSYKTSQRGFTLIEVMIVVLIIAVMSTLGIASYFTFIEENQVKGAAQEVQTFLRDIQNKAKMGDRGVGTCSTNGLPSTVLNNTFKGWRVSFVGGKVSAQPTCSAGSGDASGDAEYLTLPTAMYAEIAPTGALTFKPLYSNIDPAADRMIRVYDTRNASICYYFTIDTGGNIKKVAKCP
jgi:prepilin-type N-terminal cleavage/methylation domain-containing protein